MNKKPSPVFKHLLEQVVHLEPRAEEVVVEGRDHEKNQYRMLTPDELKEKMKNQPANHRICKLKLQVINSSAPFLYLSLLD